jgi:uncharacterized repeat protein (TIGR03803 family)
VANIPRTARLGEFRERIMPFFKSIAVAAVSAIATLHVHTASAASELVIYSFMGAGGFDGSNPAGNLLNVGGTLYGTTLYGGSYNDGTAFSVTTRGVEKVHHTFHGGTDGSQPYDGLVHRHGVLYGTTYYGGDHGNGAIFSLTTGGVERVFNSFKSGTDGLEPAAGRPEWRVLRNHVTWRQHFRLWHLRRRRGV